MANSVERWTLSAARQLLPQVQAGAPRGCIPMRAGVLEIAPCGDRLRVRFNATPRTENLALQLQAEYGGVHWSVEVDSLEGLLAGADAACAEASDAVREVVLTQLVTVLWDAIGAAPPVPRLSVTTGAHVSSVQRFGFVVENRATGGVTRGWLGLPTVAQAQMCAAALARLAPTPLPLVPIDVRFMIGTARLELAQLRALHPGAVVLLARLPSRGGRWVASVLAGSRRTVVASAYIEGDNIVIDKVNPAPTGEPRVGSRSLLEAVAVELAFEIGRSTMPIEELLRLAPGHVFELGAQPEGDVVELTLNGRVVGAGHLVLVGETLGVRVARLWLDDPVVEPAQATQLATTSATTADAATSNVQKYNTPINTAAPGATTTFGTPAVGTAEQTDRQAAA